MTKLAKRQLSHWYQLRKIDIICTYHINRVFPRSW